MADESTRNCPVTAFEDDAEFLVLEQLDLLAQVEAQFENATVHLPRRKKGKGRQGRCLPWRVGSACWICP